jgi:DNA processing protein
MLLNFFGDPQNIWEASDNLILDCSPLIGYTAAKSLIEHRNQKDLDKAISIISNSDVSILTLNDSDYPNLLKTIYNPPPILYYKGASLKNLGPIVAIVGSRKASQYGMQMAERFAYELSRAGVTIISGAARGIDTMAHWGALHANASTIAVLGCGVDIVYPKENKKLFDCIQEHGTLISEFPLGTPPLPGNFPLRNRIISGLAHAVLVVEAGMPSGALITVDHALEQGRDVYALPGNVNNRFNKGSNKLLKEGAKVVTCVEDILEDLDAKTDYISTSIPQDVPLQLDLSETLIYNALEDGQKQQDELGLITGIDPGTLSAILTLLEMKGIIKQLPGKIFIKQSNI